MRQTFSVFLVLSMLGACSATSVGSMDPIQGGSCTKKGVVAIGADGCTVCTCGANGWSCQGDACDAKTCTSGERKLADDGCNACRCNAQGAWVCTSGAACPGGDGGAPPVEPGMGGAGTDPEPITGGSSPGITDPTTGLVTGQCAARTAAPPAPPPASAAKQPCDIYAEDGGPCVAAHSTVRALYATYDGPLYQVRRADGTVRDIGVNTPGGFADSAEQDRFCADASCTISLIYDQSGYQNDLRSAPPGGAKSTPDNEAFAAGAPATFAGQKVYGVHVVPGVGYRNNDACGTATGDNAETEYMVVAGDIYNGGCCFDYGNMERDSRDDGEGAAEAVYFGRTTIWNKGAGEGPWVMGDLENGLWAGSVSPQATNLSLDHKFVTAMLKGDGPGTNHWTIKSGDAQAGLLTTPFDGPRPSVRYTPMRKQGAIGLGIAGDNSSGGLGNFFEGVMTAHYSSNKADNAVQANIISVYGPR